MFCPHRINKKITQTQTTTTNNEGTGTVVVSKEENEFGICHQGECAAWKNNECTHSQVMELFDEGE
jgi:hypothetical protein